MSTKALPRAFRRSIVCQGVHEGSASKAWVFQDVHEGFASGVPTFEGLGFSRCPRRLCLRRSDVRLFATVSTKALPLRLGFSKMSTKALPQAFRRSIVRSGCSILLLSILKVVSLRCFLSSCSVMLGLSKRFILTFLSSGSCRQVLLEVSFFFVHCTKAL